MTNIWTTTRRTPSVNRTTSDHRTAWDHDYDRLLFSTPVRRLADKTQVFPLDKSDAVRTRLTHSHEVANLARSMGLRLLKEGFSFPNLDAPEAVPAILSAIGLAHDLGNPPFGHQGEAAIGNWFVQNIKLLGDVPTYLFPEFLEFEGNAQAIRILTRLQVSLGGYGLDMTAATLSALLKYPVSCDKRDKSRASCKKFGYFESEHQIVEWIRTETGLEEGQRHPLTWLMEAADDIAYSVLDIEDAMHKGIISPDDVRALINHHLDADYESMLTQLDSKFSEVRKLRKSISETREIMSSYLRTAFITSLINDAVEAFKRRSSDIFSYSIDEPILHTSSLLDTLKNIAKDHVFVSSDIRKIEADGFRVIGGLMSFYWYAISNRKDPEDLISRRTDAKASFGISKLSDNYLQCAAAGGWIDRNGDPLGIRYRELRLLTDMVSGMTDGFAMSEYQYLQENEFLK